MTEWVIGSSPPPRLSQSRTLCGDVGILVHVAVYEVRVDVVRLPVLTVEFHARLVHAQNVRVAIAR